MTAQVTECGDAVKRQSKPVPGRVSCRGIDVCWIVNGLALVFCEIVSMKPIICVRNPQIEAQSFRAPPQVANRNP